MQTPESLSRASSEIDLSTLGLYSPAGSHSRQPSLSSLNYLSGQSSPRESLIIDTDDGDSSWQKVIRKRAKMEEASVEAEREDTRLHWNWFFEIKRVRYMALIFRKHELLGDELPEHVRIMAAAYGDDEMNILKKGIQLLSGYPGIEVLYEEYAWAIMRRLDSSPASTMTPEKIKDHRSKQLACAKEKLLLALECKLCAGQRALSTLSANAPFLHFIGAVKELTLKSSQRFQDTECRYHFLRGVTFILRSLGHCYSYMSESGSLEQRIYMSRVARTLFQMKTLCPPPPEVAAYGGANTE